MMCIKHIAIFIAIFPGHMGLSLLDRCRCGQHQQGVALGSTTHWQSEYSVERAAIAAVDCADTSAANASCNDITHTHPERARDPHSQQQLISYLFYKSGILQYHLQISVSLPDSTILSAGALQAQHLEEVLQDEGAKFLETYPVPMLTWEEVKALKGPGLVGLGAPGGAPIGKQCSGLTHPLADMWEQEVAGKVRSFLCCNGALMLDAKLCMPGNSMNNNSTAQTQHATSASITRT